MSGPLIRRSRTPGEPRGPRTLTLRLAGDRLSMRVAARPVAVSAVTAAAAAVAAAVALATGDYPVAVSDVVRSLLGHGDAGTDFVVTALRLPRVLTGLLVGAALAVSGAILQSLTRNPLGSPDFVGFTQGSATGALVAIVVLHGGAAAVATGALVGGVAAAAVIYALAAGRGAAGARLVLTGIGVSAMLLSVNQYLVTRATFTDAVAAQVWLTGSLNGRRWQDALTVGLAVALLLPVALGYGRRLALLEMGDDAAKALGVPVERTRLVLVTTSVGLSAVATAAAGPIAFVALAAPQLTRRLTRAAGPGLVAAALGGAGLLVACDLAVQRLFAPAQLPVGIATSAVGGLYLTWLLAHEWRGRRR